MTRSWYKGFRQRHAAPAHEKVRKAYEANQIFWVGADGTIEVLTVEQDGERDRTNGYRMPPGVKRYYTREEAEKASAALASRKGAQPG